MDDYSDNVLKDDIVSFNVSSSVVSKNWSSDFVVSHNLLIVFSLIKMLWVVMVKMRMGVKIFKCWMLCQCINTKKDDVDFVIDKTVLDLSMKYVDPKGL